MTESTCSGYETLKPIVHNEKIIAYIPSSESKIQRYFVIEINND